MSRDAKRKRSAASVKKKVTPAMMSEIMLCRLRTLALTGYEVCNDSGTLTRHDERAMQLFEDWLEARFKIRFSYRATPRKEPDEG